MLSQYGELRPISGWDRFTSLGHSHQISMGFGSWLHYCTAVAQRRSTTLCTMFGRLLGCYTIYTLSRDRARSGMLPSAEFTFRQSLAFSGFCSVFTARQSSSGRQPNFAAFSRGRHLHLAGRPSRWASAHILVYY